jgi:tRNA-Thr(GGU) m(6)t(6)A37 methyltransferase TsaA
MTTETYNVTPIGRVSVKNGSFALRLDSRYVAGLRELDGFSHIVVLWWCHHLDAAEYRALTEFEQPYRKSPAKVGVFATRSPARPNPIAATAVGVLRIDHKEGIVHLPFIDAEDGSPVLDIKPYHPCTDRVRELSVPAWCSHWPQWYEDSGSFDWAAEFVNAR